MSGLDLARLKEAVAHIKAVPWTDAASAAVVALVNAADELIAAAEERDRLRVAMTAAIERYERRDPPGTRGYVTADLIRDMRAALKEKP